jgi:hypothetical protein
LVYGDLKLAAALEGSLFAILTLFKTHSQVIYEIHEACDLLRLNVDDATKNGGAHHDLIPVREHRNAHNHVSQIPKPHGRRSFNLQLQNSHGDFVFLEKARKSTAGSVQSLTSAHSALVCGARY